MPPKSFDAVDDNNMGVTSNINTPNNAASMNPNNPNQQHQDFNLDDLNFDPAALIGGNGENTDLNVSFQAYIKVKYAGIKVNLNKVRLTF